jgi:hypothetical protein
VPPCEAPSPPKKKPPTLAGGFNVQDRWEISPFGFGSSTFPNFSKANPNPAVTTITEKLKIRKYILYSFSFLEMKNIPKKNARAATSCNAAHTVSGVAFMFNAISISYKSIVPPSYPTPHKLAISNEADRCRGAGRHRRFLFLP